ncbi:MAG: hypothetical protein U5R48_18425 [Gammaproteobacteria bacterium]|nr:hypothetical protein [Gammaproteobacteria bacterium]
MTLDLGDESVTLLKGSNDLLILAESELITFRAAGRRRRLLVLLRSN